VSLPLPERAPGQCCAIVETTEGAAQYTMQRIRMTRPKRCSRKAVQKIGPLEFCTTHVRMTRDGLVDEGGNVADKSTCADVRRYPRNFPDGIYGWHQKYPTEKK